ncbi:DUF1064 domain-containing protein [Geosporobacter subterraneus]|nr:DUF1064 domain-containing protein [Geosporobacter subterraneus]
MRWTKEQYQAYLEKQEKKSKYGAKKTEVDGIVFDSQREANYYCELKMLKQAGEIRDFALQPKYILLPRDDKSRGITYKADFIITHNDGSKEIIDVKGFETKDFKLKKKLFEHNYPDLKLTIVK